MALTHANLGAVELANLALDKPLLGVNVIPVAPTLERWNHEGTVSGADHTAAGYPIARAHDNDPELVTKADNSVNDQYIVYNFGTTVDVDFCAIAFGHSLYTDAITSLSLDFDDNQNGAFSAVHSCDLLGAFPPANNHRIMQLDLDPAAIGTPQRFSGVQYCRVHIGKGAGITPQITELVIGARYQMPRWPRYGFNADNIGNITESGDPTKGGVIDSTNYARNQFKLDAEWTLKSSETADLRAWWKKYNGSFLWVWQPSTSPAAFHLMVRDEERLDLPYDGWNRHTFTLSATEQGPESKYLENE